MTFGTSLCNVKGSEVICGHVLTWMMHNAPIPVNDSESRGWKHVFLEKLAGGCSCYPVLSCYVPVPVIARWPDPVKNFRPKVAQRSKGCLISYAKFQRGRPSESAAISEKLMEVDPPPPHLHWRGLNTQQKLWIVPRSVRDTLHAVLRIYFHMTRL